MHGAHAAGDLDAQLAQRTQATAARLRQSPARNDRDTCPGGDLTDVLSQPGLPGSRLTRHHERTATSISTQPVHRTGDHRHRPLPADDNRAAHASILRAPSATGFPPGA